MNKKIALMVLTLLFIVNILHGQTIVDLLVAYTTEAKNDEGGETKIIDLIKKAVSDANESFIASDISLKYNIVKIYESSFYEGTHTDSYILEKFETDTLIANLRSEYNADLCFLMFSNSYRGKGEVPPDDNPTSSTANLGFSVGNFALVKTIYTLAHETGHNFGARHDINNWPAGSYNHGYIAPNNSWGTIMAILDEPDNRANIWSNPDKYYNGIPSGNSQANNALWLNEQKQDIANYLIPELSGSLTKNQTFSGREFKLLGNLIIPSGKTLKIESSATLNLNNYFIKSTGGAIILEDNIDGNFVEVKTGSNTKALYQTIILAINNANSGQTVSSFGEQILNNNIIVESGVTFIVKSNSNLDINNFYVRSTGGTIIQESGSTINGLNAYLKYNSTLKGFFPSISSAINNAGSYYTVELLSKTYNQSISTSKDYFTLKGKGYNSTYINGDITFTNADHTNIKYLKTKTISTNNSYVDLYSLKAERFSIYGDEVQVNYVRTNGGGQIPNQITNADGTVDNSNLEDMMIGMDMTSNSAYNVQSYFCGNDADINAFSGSVAYAWYNDAFSYNPDYSCSGNVHYIWKNVCGMNKRTENGTKEKVNTSKSKDELEEIDQDYTSLLKRVNDDYVEKGEVDMKKYENDYNNVIDDYKSFLEKYPSSAEAPTAIFRTVHCYQQQDNYKGYDEFINVFLANKKYEAIRPHVQRHNIDLDVEEGKYKEAIEVAENIINNYKIDEDLYCELLYEKGLIFKYHLNEKEEAEKMFKTIVENYPKNKMFSYAEIELGENETKDEKGEVKESLETKKNNFGIESYPNPFNPSTTLSYSLPTTSNVKLEIYDVMGRMIKSFTTNTQSSGKHQVVWDGTNSNGVKVSTGIYIYRFEATSIETNEHFVKSAKLMLIK